VVRPQPLVVELVGPAGSGKSTLWQLLTGRRRVVGAKLWDLPRPLLAESALRTLPAMVAVVRRSGTLPWEDLKQVIRLDALGRSLRALRSADHELILVDEGVVFALSFLRVLGSACFRDSRLDLWWQRTLDAWAPLLDGVILLDAPDRLLVHRIRTRAKPHLYKHRSESEINQFSAAYRNAFNWVLAGLTARSGLRVVPIHSNGADPTAVAEQVLAAFDQVAHAR
jgi:thymidylate kinase